MVLVGGCIGIIMIIICIIVLCYGGHEGGGMAFGTAGGVLLVLTLIASITLGVNVVDSRYIDEKIAMYASENEKIESDVRDAVEAYKGYERDTFETIADKSPLSLVTLFPELKSDAIISKQIDVYVSNNNDIKKLKLKAIGYKSSKWWLYFGA